MYKEKIPAIYIMSNAWHSTLYVGVSSDLIKRIYEHKNGIKKGFTSKYKCNKLVYYEVFDTMEQAILREKQIKAGNRARKESMIQSKNPEWRDLYEEICE